MPNSAPDPMAGAVRWAWTTLRHNLGGFGVSTLAFGIASVFVGAFITEPASPTLSQRLANGLIAFGSALVLAVILGSAVLLFLAPYQQRKALREAVGVADDKYRAYVANTAKLLTPQLAILGGDGPEFDRVLAETVDHPLGPPETVVRQVKTLVVENLAGLEAPRCRVRITEVHPPYRHVNMSRDLAWLHRGEPTELDLEAHGRGRVILNRHTDFDGPVSTVAGAPRAKQRYMIGPLLDTPEAEITITVRAWSAGGAAVERSFVVSGFHDMSRADLSVRPIEAADGLTP